MTEATKGKTHNTIDCEIEPRACTQCEAKKEFYLAMNARWRRWKEKREEKRRAK